MYLWIWKWFIREAEYLTRQLKNGIPIRTWCTRNDCLIEFNFVQETNAIKQHHKTMNTQSMNTSDVQFRMKMNYKHREEALLFYTKTIWTNYHSKYHELSHAWKLMKHERYGQKLTPSVSSQQPPSYRKSHRSSWAPRIRGGSWWCMALNNNSISIYEYAFYAERTFILQWCLTLRSWLLAEKGSNLI